MKQSRTLPFRRAACLAAALTFTASAYAAGVPAELRSAAAILPSPVPGGSAPTAPAGGVAFGTQPWVCDAARGFAPVIPIEPIAVDPLLAIGAAGAIKLPISPTTVPATCGQAAFAANGTVYVTQAIVDTTVTPSAARGILRTVLDPSTGALVGPTTYIAVTAGLDGDQPTAAAIGPDGNLYIGFLKNGNVKRVLNPGSGTAQAVQSVGVTPSGHASRAFAFVGNDLYIGSIDAFSIIHNATSTSCTGGCNAVAISDGFTGVPHVAMASDGVNVFFSVAGNPQSPGSNQVWRYNPVSALYTFVAQGGADRNGANASNFSFAAAKTNLLALDPLGNLWIGDDISNAAAPGNGRLWTVSAAALAGLPAGSFTAGTNVQTLYGILRGPWLFSFLPTMLFEPTFNADGTFTAIILNGNGIQIGTEAGTWVLTPPNFVQPFTNPQARLTMTNNSGSVLLAADIIMFTVDHIGTMGPSSGSLNPPGVWVANKFAP